MGSRLTNVHAGAPSAILQVAKRYREQQQSLHASQTEVADLGSVRDALEAKLAATHAEVSEVEAANGDELEMYVE